MGRISRSTAEAETTGRTSPRPRFAFLDGIRGLAAMYVLVYHALPANQIGDTGFRGEDRGLSAPMRAIQAVFAYGHTAVTVFIVLSGFSLMIPIAQSGRLALRNGFRNYLHRRSRRILPTYYAALVFSVIAVVGAASLSGSGDASESLSGGALASHVLLVHNLEFDWAFRINGPMWSVATEWQIYFLFPLVLLPLWRRIGGAATVLVAWAAAVALNWGVPPEHNLFWASPWFVGSFALGMWAATAVFGADRSPRLGRDVPWGVLTGISLAVFVAMVAIRGFASYSLLVTDAVASVGAMLGILACVRAHNHHIEGVTGRVGRSANRFLGSHPVVWLGAISYSIYLLQHPLLRLSETALRRFDLSFEAAHWVQLLISVPAIVVIARIFAELFELPFTSGSRTVSALKERLRRPLLQPAGQLAPSDRSLSEPAGG